MRRTRRFWIVSLLVGVLAIAGTSVWIARSSNDQAEVIDDSGRDGWKRLEFREVQVSVPADWGRQDSEDCLGAVEHWGPETTESCGDRRGVDFLDSSTFDAAIEPGTVASSRDTGQQFWHGYVRLDDVVVAASGPERDVVREVLDSASSSGFVTTE